MMSSQQKVHYDRIKFLEELLMNIVFAVFEAVKPDEEKHKKITRNNNIADRIPDISIGWISL